MEEKNCSNCGLAPRGSHFGCEGCSNNYENHWKPKNDNDSDYDIIEGNNFVTIIDEQGITCGVYLK